MARRQPPCHPQQAMMILLSRLAPARRLASPLTGGCRCPPPCSAPCWLPSPAPSRRQRLRHARRASARRHHGCTHGDRRITSKGSDTSTRASRDRTSACAGHRLQLWRDSTRAHITHRTPPTTTASDFADRERAAPESACSEATRCDAGNRVTAGAYIYLACTSM